MLSARIIKTLLRGLDRVTPKSPRANIPAHLLTGRRGEEEAYFFLRKKGYIIVARNFRTARHRGEIDLIGWDKDVLCFIEVKTRTTHDIKPAEAAVDRKKRRDLRVVIRYYLRTLPRRQFPVVPQWRFDIVTVYYDNDNSFMQEGKTPLNLKMGLNGSPCPSDGEHANPPFAKIGRKGGATKSSVLTPTFELFQNAALSS